MKPIVSGGSKVGDWEGFTRCPYR